MEYTKQYEKMHPTYKEYVAIELRFKDGWTAYRIAKQKLHCATHTDGGYLGEVFWTITTDNGSKFTRLGEVETIAQTLVYYAHL